MNRVCISQRTAQYILDAIKSSGVGTNWDREDAIAELEAALSYSPSTSPRDNKRLKALLALQEIARLVVPEGSVCQEIAIAALASQKNSK